MNKSSHLPFSIMDFRPMDVVDRIIHYWWIMVVFMLLGGVVGFCISLFLPQQFEAQAIISVAIDYTRTGFLTDIEEDQTVEIVGDVIYSDEVIQKAASAVADNVEANFREKLNLERKNNQWLLKVMSSDPKQAAEVANVWVEEAFNELENVQNHAIKAEGYQRYLDALASCLEESVVIEPAHSKCNLTGINQLTTELEKTGKLVTDEKLASRGIMPAVSYTISQKASEPTQPIRTVRGLIMLCSALVGFLISFFLFWFTPPVIIHTGKVEA